MGKNEDGINKPIEAVFKSHFTSKDTAKNSNKFGE